MTTEAEEIENERVYEPLVVATIYYIIVLGLTELTRRGIEKVLSKKSSLYLFLIEFIATVSICVCVFENGVILVNYGIGAFFIVSSVLGYFFGTLGRGAFGTPMGPVEGFIYGEITLQKLIILVIAEVLGGIFSFRITMELWRQSLFYVDSHFEFYKSGLKGCTINHKHAFVLMMTFEVFGAFLMRTVIPRMPEKVAKYIIPAFISAIFSFSILYIGDAGLDPIVASSLFFGCSGLSQQWFILQYWLCPVIGWLAAAYLDRRSKVKPVKKPKEAKKKEKPQPAKKKSKKEKEQ